MIPLALNSDPEGAMSSDDADVSLVPFMPLMLCLAGFIVIPKHSSRLLSSFFVRFSHDFYFGRDRAHTML